MGGLKALPNPLRSAKRRTKWLPVSLDQVFEADGRDLADGQVQRRLHRHPQQAGHVPRLVLILRDTAGMCMSRGVQAEPELPCKATSSCKVKVRLLVR